MRKYIFIGIAICLALLLTACGGTATPLSPPSGKPVNIVVTTKPSPPVMGDVEVILTLTDSNGRPLEGATVEVTADHIDMSGMTMRGPATDQGRGVYTIQANFSMSGNWKLTVQVRKEGLEYREDIALKVH